MAKSNPTVKKIGWIIHNKGRNTIWKQTYHSKEEAEKELRDQIFMIQKTRPTYRGEEWKIHSFEYTVEEKPDEALKDFQGF